MNSGRALPGTCVPQPHEGHTENYSEQCLYLMRARYPRMHDMNQWDFAYHKPCLLTSTVHTDVDSCLQIISAYLVA